MKEISSLKKLKETLQTNKNVWLLLYKKGSEKSDCAFENYKSISKESTNEVLLHADVNRVRDIHTEYGVNSVPTLLNFENEELKNVVKGCHQPGQLKGIFEKASVAVVTNGETKPQKNVTVYTTPTCTWCTTVKRHLDENGVRYREVNVAANQTAAEEMVKRSGQQGVPQTDINGQIVVGFDKVRINSLLGIN